MNDTRVILAPKSLGSYTPAQKEPPQRRQPFGGVANLTRG